MGIHRASRRMNSRHRKRDVGLRRRLVPHAGEVHTREVRSVEALFASRGGARRGLPISQRRLYLL
ncbi:MAG TPA: hypothetical protein VK358_02700, partial [Longimicrobium sp.]|nr:hypothetical protein [Longimicrobium sp.]